MLEVSRRKLAVWLLLLWKKIIEKSTLYFSMVRNANVFDPISLTNLEPVELRANMRNLLTQIVSLKILSTTLAE